jgi:hypothetical protein
VNCASGQGSGLDERIIRRATAEALKDAYCATWPRSRLGTQWVQLHSAWFNSEFVVHCGPEPLLTTDVAFGCLHGDMTEKELDLFEFSAGGMAKPCTGSTKVVG